MTIEKVVIQSSLIQKIQLKKHERIGKKTFIYLIGLFLISIVARSFLGFFNGEMSVFYDELVHWKNSQSFFYQGHFEIRGFYRPASDILYSFFLSTVHFFARPIQAYKIAIFFNSVLLSSSVFPVYLLCSLFLKNKKTSYLICALTIMLPEFSYTAGILQENLYYPAVLWIFYFIVLFLFQPVLTNIKTIHFLILGFTVFLLSLIKQMGLFIALSLVLVFLYVLFCNKAENRKKMLLVLSLFVTIIVGLYFLFAIILQNLNVYVPDIEGISFFQGKMQIFKKIIDNPYYIFDYLYAFLNYFVKIIVVMGIAPVLIPLAFWSNLNQTVKRMLVFIYSQIICIVFYVVFSFYTSENLGSPLIRFHYRYLFYYFIPLLIIFFSVLEKSDIVFKLKHKILLIAFCGIFCISLFWVDIGKNGYVFSVIDAPSMQFFLQTHSLLLSMKIGICFLTGLCIILYFKKKNKALLGVILFFILSLAISGNFFQYKTLEKNKTNSSPLKNDMRRIDDYFLSLEKEIKEPVLFLNPTTNSLCVAENYFAYPYYYLQLENLPLIEDWKQIYWDIDFSSAKFLGVNKQYLFPEDFTLPEYLIVPNNLSKFQFIGYNSILENEKVDLLKREMPNTSIKAYSIYSTNWYTDKWITEIGQFSLGGRAGLYQQTLILTCVSPNYKILKIKVIDGTGATQELVIDSEPRDYKITVFRIADDEPFVFDIIPEETFIPGRKDQRRLSFQLLDMNIDYKK